MKNQEQVKNFNEEKFNRAFGVYRQTFQVMLSELEEQYRIAHRKGGRRPKLTIFDRLCIFFAYYRDYRTFEDIANNYDVTTSTVFDTISLVEKTLSAKFTLQQREELIKNPPELIIVDTTEIEIEQPKKGL
ncbi:MAG: transposase family protein [Synergistaceae bacterium]|nr:transposase family protein [Synergistaceae bacterium]